MKDLGDGVQAKRKGDLTISALDDEVLVYDPETTRASCLNSFAAEVLALCDGRRSASDITRDLPLEDVDERMVWLALADLQKAQLLQDGSAVASNAYARTNRRDLLRRIGVGSAVAIPVVVGIALPTAAQAQTCLPNGAPCNEDSMCCSGNCDDECEAGGG